MNFENIEETGENNGAIRQRLIVWCKTHLTDKQFTLILSFFVGLFAAIAAFILHWIIRHIEMLLTEGFDKDNLNLLYLVYPVIGIYLTSLFVRYIVKDNISHGITRILYAISGNRSKLRGHNCWSSVIASAITIGFGGSVGAEAPIVLTGSAIGSNLGQLFKMDNKTLMLLVGCGAAAAIAGVFKAPIAGLVFTLEVLMIDLTMASLLPILISGVTATCFTYIFSNGDSLFQFHLDGAWMMERVPAYILLGVFGGIISLYFIRTMNACEGVFARLKERPMARLVLGGAMLSTLILFFPSLYGEGYSSINILLNGKTEADWNTVLNNSIFAGHGNMLILYIIMVLFTKVLATSATNGGGGCGGTFAPSLFMGAFGGFLFARVWNMHGIGVYIPEKNFVMLGMAAVMAGVMHAPLTGIFLIAEITGGYQQFIPLMIVCICSYLTIIIFEPHGIYGMRLAREGKLITHHTDHAALTLMSLDSVIERHFTPVSPETELGMLIHSISRSRTDLLPVLDKDGNFMGEIDLSKLRHIVFRTELYHKFKVAQLMSQPPCTLSTDDTMEKIMKQFESTGAMMLPVMDDDKRLIGYVNRMHLYGVYRQMVADLSAE